MPQKTAFILTDDVLKLEQGREMDKLKQLRIEAKLTQEELAKRAKVGRAYLTRLENGIGNPTRETLTKIATALNCKISDLVD